MAWLNGTRIALIAAAALLFAGVGMAPAAASGGAAESSSEETAVSAGAIIYTSDRCYSPDHRCFILEYTVDASGWGTGVCFTSDRNLRSHTGHYDKISSTQYFYIFRTGEWRECASYGSGRTDGSGQSIRNNAAFGYNKDTWCHAVFYHEDYDGAYIVYPPNSAGLLGSLRNDNASSRAYPCSG
ncbi:hypothetical protein [Streptomyces sp. YIM 98790]|uniref:hypothetical protein n=1 Tax=Streptomyces sp. YIM 98790 TaxID=2689077 RepID=UPI00140AD922|nr:hypothetical protein [Streptomyces sp. YIM 98790]